jgi:hypothetical protein
MKKVLFISALLAGSAIIATAAQLPQPLESPQPVAPPANESVRPPDQHPSYQRRPVRRYHKRHYRHHRKRHYHHKRYTYSVPANTVNYPGTTAFYA